MAAGCPVQGGIRGFTWPFLVGPATAQGHRHLHLYGQGYLSNVEKEPIAPCVVGNIQIYSMSVRQEASLSCPALSSVSQGFEGFGGFSHSFLQGRHNGRHQVPPGPEWGRGLGTFRAAEQSCEMCETGEAKQDPSSMEWGMAHSASGSGKFSLLIFWSVEERVTPIHLTTVK